MATVDERGSGRTRSVLRDLGAAMILAMLAVDATWWLLELPASYILVGLVFYVVLARLVLWTLPSDVPGPGIGPANRVTLGRAALTVPVFALAVWPNPTGDRGAWRRR